MRSQSEIFYWYLIWPLGAAQFSAVFYLLAALATIRRAPGAWAKQEYLLWFWVTLAFNISILVSHLLLFALALAKALMESNSCPSPPPAPPSLTFSDLPPPTCGRGSYEMANVYAVNAHLAVYSIVCAVGSYLLLPDGERAASSTASTLAQPMLTDAQQTVNVDPLPAWTPVTGAEAPVHTS